MNGFPGTFSLFQSYSWDLTASFIYKITFRNGYVAVNRLPLAKQYL